MWFYSISKYKYGDPPKLSEVYVLIKYRIRSFLYKYNARMINPMTKTIIHNDIL